MAQDDGLPRQAEPEDRRIPLVEEIVEVEKRQVAAGKVRIQTAVDTIEETVRADLEGVEVDVRRVPVDRVVTETPQVRTEGYVTIVPVVEEVLFVEKRLVLKEELHISRRSTMETVEIPVTLRKERASIERVAGGNSNASEEKSQ